MGIKYFLYLMDDFRCLTPLGGESQQAMDNILKLFHDLGIPLNTGKTEGPVHRRVYLGVELCSDTMEARLPKDKLNRIVDIIQDFQKRK